MPVTDIPLVLTFEPGSASVTHLPGHTLDVTSNHAFDLPQPHLVGAKGHFSARAQPLSVSFPYAGGFIHHLVLSVLWMGGDVPAHLAALSRAERLPYVVHPFPETSPFRIQWRVPSRLRVRSLRFSLTRRNQAWLFEPSPPTPIGLYLLPRIVPAAIRPTEDGLFLWIKLA